MGHVLLIEDEPSLRVNMARGIGKLPGVSVTDVGTLGEALAVIDRAAPDFIVSDIDLPERSGLELLGELTARRLRVPVLYISAYLKAYGGQIPPNADVDVLEKPVSLDDLREQVQRRCAPPREDDVPFGVADFVQLAAMGRHTVRLECFDAQRRPTGTVVMVRGELWSAVDDKGEGKDAFGRLCLRERLTVRCVNAGDSVGPRNVEGSWEALLLDAAREADESAVGGRGRRTSFPPPRAAALTSWRPPSAPPMEAAPEVVDDGFAMHWEEAVLAMLARDHDAARAALEHCRQLRPDDQAVLANLQRLDALKAREVG
jgi:CheY-like chemotaxis protein